MSTIKVEYSSNNSGGDWWLSDDDWENLEKAGWEVAWGGKYFCRSKSFMFTVPEGMAEPCADREKCQGHRRASTAAEAERWLGALAKSATRTGLPLRDAIEEWERVTGQNAASLGCSCCGTPHYFQETVDGNYTESYSPEYPTYGERP